jgi:hypothetical protein
MTTTFRDEAFRQSCAADALEAIIGKLHEEYVERSGALALVRELTEELSQYDIDRPIGQPNVDALEHVLRLLRFLEGDLDPRPNAVPQMNRPAALHHTQAALRIVRDTKSRIESVGAL